LSVKAIALSLLVYFSLISNCYAYLDMGTGGYVLQGILAGFFTTIFFVKAYWNKALILLTKLFKKK